MISAENLETYIPKLRPVVVGVVVVGVVVAAAAAVVVVVVVVVAITIVVIVVHVDVFANVGSKHKAKSCVFQARLRPAPPVPARR